jgi:hypothetical protein
MQMDAICRGLSCDSKWRRKISLVFLIGNRFSGNMFSFASGKHPPGITNAACPYHPAITDSVPCGPLIPFHVDRDSATTQNADRFPAESWTTSNGTTGPLPLESLDHIDRNPQHTSDAAKLVSTPSNALSEPESKNVIGRPAI